MSGTYKATGINLKTMPLGEADRLVTILTKEHGLIRVVAPGARKQKNSLSPRSGLFIVNDLLIVAGKSIDKMIQAETKNVYAGLSKDIGKLTAGQYLAEIVIAHALSEQPQTELFEILTEHLRRIEALPPQETSILLAHLSQAVFHILALVGLSPQVQTCCLTQAELVPDFAYTDWLVGFSSHAGGAISLDHLEDGEPLPPQTLTALELSLMQQLAQPHLPQLLPDAPWRKIERLLRDYTQYQLGRSLQSANFIDILIPQ